MVRISIPHYGTTEQVDVPRVSRKNSVSCAYFISYRLAFLSRSVIALANTFF